MFARMKPIRSTIVTVSTVALLVSGLQARDRHVTAREVVTRIQRQVGVPWQSDTVDTFKAGSPDAPVSGIAVTMMATLDVLQRAVAAGDNLIITHEPTFFDHRDVSDQLPEKDDDPVLVAKRKFVADHNLVIWRFHDHWHARNPDGIEAGMVHALGWEKFQDPHKPVSEYVADAVSEGKQKSLIILGPIPSEQAGMEECTRWLKTFVTEVPIQFVPAREPFWSPKP